jgi:hypothetical protein
MYRDKLRSDFERSKENSRSAGKDAGELKEEKKSLRMNFGVVIFLGLGTLNTYLTV